MSLDFPARDSSPFETRSPIKVEVRGTIIPSFYERHPEDGKGIIVKKDGVPLVPTFTVDRVPPERRWAIRANGEILDQSTFEQLLARVYEEGSRAYSHNGRMSGAGNVKNLAYPRVERYVSVEIDPTNPSRFIPMGYVSHPPKAKKQIPERYYDSSGDPVEAKPIDVILDAYFDSRGRKTLKPHELEAAEEHLHEQRESRMAHAPKVEAQPEKKSAKKRPYSSGVTHTAPCGKTGVKNLPGHTRFCKACAQVQEHSEA